MDKDDIIEIMKKLAKKRKIFHSEADFQFSLSQEIKETFPESIIRLERPIRGPGKRKELDIEVETNGRKTAIELKYLKGAINVKTDDDEYDLRYDPTDYCAKALEDIKRLEDLGDAYKSKFFIGLSNYHVYWEQPKKQTEFVYDNFRIYEGRTVDGNTTLKWKEERPPPKKHWVEPFSLQHTYILKWHDYSKLNDDKEAKNSTFRYLLVEVK